MTNYESMDKAELIKRLRALEARLEAQNRHRMMFDEFFDGIVPEQS